MKPLRVHRDVIVVCASAFVLFLPLLVGGVYVYQKHRWAQELLSQLEPRYARLIGLEQQRVELNESSARVLLAQQQYVYPADMDVSQAGNAAQQQIREIFAAAGLQISSSQVMQPQDEKGYDRIVLKVQAEGDLLSLQSVLMVLGRQKPSVMIDALNVQLIGSLQMVSAGKQSPVRLTTQFSLSVLKDRR